MATDVLQQEMAEGVGWLRLNRPGQANALNGALRTELLAALAALNDDASVRVVVLEGAGRHFCAGTELAEVVPSSAHIERVREPNTRALTLLRTGKPAIALVRGAAAGIGLSLALACDLRVATPDARLVSAFGRLGLSADGGLTWLLSRTVGLARAMEMLYTEEAVDAARAERWGLLNAVVAEEEIVAHVRALALRLASRSGDALAAMKQSMNEASSLDFAEAMSREFDRQARLMDGADFHARFEQALAAMRQRGPA